MSDKETNSETTNPYAVPVAEVSTTPIEVDFADVIRRWEKARFVYNGVLVFFTIIFTSVYPSRFLDLDYWASVFIGAILANLCYFAGPVIEGYGRYFRIWQPIYMKVLFVVGLSFASLLAVLFIVTY